MNLDNSFAIVSPLPCREKVEAASFRNSTPILTFPLKGGRNWYALIFLLLWGTAHAAPFPGGDATTGKKLFDKYQCNNCHRAKMGGDGSAIFTRPDHKVTSPEKMAAQIKMCSGNVGANLTPEEIQHLGAYLNQTYYKFR